MSDERTIAHAAQAQAVYDLLCQVLRERGWRFTEYKEQFAVNLTLNGDDIPMHLSFVVDATRQILQVQSRFPFKMSEEKRMEGAIASCMVTYALADGCVDYDLSDGTLGFRLTTSIRDSLIGSGLIHYFIDYTCVLVDEYNDRFLALSKGYLSLDEFIQKLNNR